MRHKELQDRRGQAFRGGPHCQSIHVGLWVGLQPYEHFKKKLVNDKIMFFKIIYKKKVKKRILVDLIFIYIFSFPNGNLKKS